MERIKYSFDMLFNDIQTAPTEGNGMPETDGNFQREYHSKLIVIQLLLDLAESYKTEDYKENEKLRKSIEIIVDGDQQLSGYLFFISQNPQFDYSWNYMRKCRANYVEFLVNSIRFFNSVLDDINWLIGKLWSEKNIHVVFHDILDVEFTSEEPFVKTRLLWENFYRLATLKSGYNIIVKAKDVLLMSGSIKEPLDTENLIDSVLGMVNNNITKNNIVNKNETD